MYTKENAEMHKKIMAAIKRDLRRPRTWEEFRRLQKEVQSMSMKSFDQAVQNCQSSFERIFKNRLNMLQMKVVFICNRAATKNLKATAQRCLEKITKIIVDYKKLEDDARLGKYELTFSVPLQKELIAELRHCFKEGRTR